MTRQPRELDSVDEGVDAVLERVGRRLVVGVPLGTGKPNRFVNALYRRAEHDATIDLTIFTALSLDPPQGRPGLERRFLAPLAERLYAGWEPLAYCEAVRRDAVPPNISIAEFYLEPGAWLDSAYAQRHHVNANYSDVAAALIARGVNVIAQLVARRGEGADARLSLGSNPDLTLDIVAGLGVDERPMLVAEISARMPFMRHDAETDAAFWDVLIDEPGYDQPLFRVPNRPVRLADHAIALHVATLVPDGGTLQLGIGSLADAIAHMIRLRHARNDAYRGLVARWLDEPQRALRAALDVEQAPFAEGLYANSEMLVEGLLHLIDAGVLERRVVDAEACVPMRVHAAFFLGSGDFYERLHALSDEAADSIDMTRVSFTNTLGGDTARKTAERRAGRFVNSAMMVALNGAAISDGLADGRIVSGVGGQHDFVTMAHALPGARSIIALPSTRTRNGRTQSNIVPSYAHVTIPAHLRDVVATEYGAADLRGLNARDTAAALICIADSRFQPQLVAAARRSGKLEGAYRVPAAYTRNTPERLAAALDARAAAELPHFPLTSELSDAEARLAVALGALAGIGTSKRAALRWLLSRAVPAARHSEALERMGLARPRSIRERVERRLLLTALRATEDSRPLRF